MKTIRIALDARTDLRECYLCCCDACCDAFAEAYEASARAIAEEYEIRIDVIRCAYSTSSHYECGDDDPADIIWQAIHEHTAWDEYDAVCVAGAVSGDDDDNWLKYGRVR